MVFGEWRSRYQWQYRVEIPLQRMLYAKKHIIQILTFCLATGRFASNKLIVRVQKGEMGRLFPLFCAISRVSIL